ncbi:MAG: Rieske 2Fe-2S domain-containing protein [Dehalococcoidia bacterium]
MLTVQENETLTRVGPGTPMGELMRRYWMPALLSEEIAEPDCPPVRVKLLGEQLVAFRDTQGRVGIFQELCTHRGASLWFGRNEESGLRCVFHGWKYDVDGNCLDMMNEPDAESFRKKIRQPNYPAVEFGGIVWTYMGPEEDRPPLPKFEWTQVPEAHRHVNKTWEECNWLQGLEGGVDTSHAPIMHRKLRPDTPHPGVDLDSVFARGKAPRLEVDVTDYGYCYWGVRELEDESMYVRGYHFIMPFTQVRPGTDFGGNKIVAGHYWVPMDDHNCMVYNWEYSASGVPMEDPEMVAKQLGTGEGELDADFRKVRNKDNSYQIDRDVQRTETFTGIFGVNTQDHAVQESMGVIYDRTKEHLGPADRAVIVARKLLQDGIRTVADGGKPLGSGESYYHVRAADAVLSKGTDWREALRSEMYPEAIER